MEDSKSQDVAVVNGLTAGGCYPAVFEHFLQWSLVGEETDVEAEDKNVWHSEQHGDLQRTFKLSR